MRGGRCSGVWGGFPGIRRLGRLSGVGRVGGLFGWFGWRFLAWLVCPGCVGTLGVVAFYWLGPAFRGTTVDRCLVGVGRGAPCPQPCTVVFSRTVTELVTDKSK